MSSFICHLFYRDHLFKRKILLSPCRVILNNSDGRPYVTKMSLTECDKDSITLSKGNNLQGELEVARYKSFMQDPFELSLFLFSSFHVHRVIFTHSTFIQLLIGVNHFHLTLSSIDLIQRS